MVGMNVNKYKINNRLLSGNTEYNVNVPISQNNGMVGQQEIIDTKFVRLEVEKAVNQIFDYEKVKVSPKLGPNITESISYKINFLLSSGTAYNTSGFWSDLGFDYNDFKLLKNSFTKTFLRLDFYDSDVSTTQNFVSFITLYPKFINSDYLATGLIPQPNVFPLQFVLGNVMLDRSKTGEGFSLYQFKDEIIPTVPKYLYMRATFNDARSGKSTGLMSSGTYNNPIDTLNRSTQDLPHGSVKNNLYTRYVLTRDNSGSLNGYYYEIDTLYSNNVTATGTVGNSYLVDLYEISVE